MLGTHARAGRWPRCVVGRGARAVRLGGFPGGRLRRACWAPRCGPRPVVLLVVPWGWVLLVLGGH
eukprot:7644211-Alexandrium_andersonii.AAC.1